MFMIKFFNVCFGVGLGYSVLVFLFGHVFDIFDFDFGADTDFDLDSSIESAGDACISPLKPAMIATFLLVFGGVGTILIRNYVLVIAFGLAAALGFIASFIIYKFIYTPLYKAQNTSAVERQSLIGTVAKVTEYIPQGRYGKLTYYVNGNTYNAPCKSEDGTEISKNETVEIVGIVKNTFFVREQK